MLMRPERWDLGWISNNSFSWKQLCTFVHQVDMRMIFAELKRDMRAAMGGKEEEKESRSIYEIKPYWRYLIEPNLGDSVYFA